MKKSLVAIIIIFGVLILDQALKIWVKTNMIYGDEFPIFGNWEKGLIHFVENDGMAFGWKLGGDYGKLALSLFRIFAVGFLIYYLRKLIEQKASMGLICSFAFILAGAIGNILDSVFYGMIFSESTYGSEIAKFVPFGQGYADILHGRVVDMFYFPLFQGVFPQWMPLVGGEPYLFFRPVFNIADASITVGVCLILFFQRSFFTSNENMKEAVEANNTSIESSIRNLEENMN